MNKYERALWRIDHTICMNSNEDNIKWNIDNKDDPELYGPDGDGYDPDDTDCKSIEDFIDCYDALEELITAFKYLAKHSRCVEHPDPFFYDDIPEVVQLDAAKLLPIGDDSADKYDENNKNYELIKRVIEAFKN